MQRVGQQASAKPNSESLHRYPGLAVLPTIGGHVFGMDPPAEAVYKNVYFCQVSVILLQFSKSVFIHRTFKNQHCISLY
jgi:hypothetical protein